MGTPQWIWVAWAVASILMFAYDHGKPAPKINFWTRSIKFVLLTALLWWGGFFGCASAPPERPQVPWLTPKPLTIYEFNQHPVTIRHGYVYVLSGGDSAGVRGNDGPVVSDSAGTETSTKSQWPAAQPFLWSFATLAGVSKLQQMTGGDPVLLPVTIVVRETGGRI